MGVNSAECFNVEKAENRSRERHCAKADAWEKQIASAGKRYREKQPAPINETCDADGFFARKPQRLLSSVEPLY